jgi:hypothetical protein
VTTFLFASVVVSGLRVLSYVSYTRRDRFILAAAMSFGIGDLLMPDVFTYLFDGVRNPSSGLQGFFDSITIVLSTPCKWHAYERVCDERWLIARRGLHRQSWLPDWWRSC